MSETCVSCRKPQIESPCGLCGQGLCRKCRIFLSADSFPLALELPAELRHSYYCGACHDQHVAPFRSEYETVAEQARSVNVIFKDSRSTIRVLKKATRPLRIENQADRDETILKLAFQAARAGFNAIIDVEVSSRKLRNAGWQSSAWEGSGLPAEISSRELDRR